MSKKPRTVWILEQKKDGTRTWEIVEGIYCAASSEVEGKARAKRFTEQSVGWKFRVQPFREVLSEPKRKVMTYKMPTECPGCGAMSGMDLCHCRADCKCERCIERSNQSSRQFLSKLSMYGRTTEER